MKSLESLRLGLRSLWRRPLRTLLVLQGVIWGVAVAVVPPAVLEGSEKIAEEQSRELGTDRITIRAQPTSSRPWLDRADLDAVRERFAGDLIAAAGYRASEATARGAGEAPTSVHLVGATGDFLTARGQELLRGRLPEEAEHRDGAPVALLEPGAAAALFGQVDPIGRTVVVALEDGEEERQTELTVIGLVAARSETARNTDDLGLDRTHPFARWLRGALRSWGLVPVDDEWKRADRSVVVPLSRAPAGRPDEIHWLIFRTGVREVSATSAEIERFLAGRGCDTEVGVNLVWPLLAGREIDRYLALNRALFLACLVMGGVVITNMMLLSVLERYREIAIRRTEGASRSDIAVQFLAEALVMGIVGTAIGVPLGLGLARLRVALEPVSMIVVVVPWRAISITAALALVTSLLAGILPAMRAARLDPVEALRCD